MATIRPVETVDVAIIGAGPAAERALDSLTDKKTILISLPNSPETLLLRHTTALLGKKTEFSAGLSAVAGPCEFIDRHTLRVGGDTVRAAKILVGSGSSHRVPKIQGLDETPHSFTTDLNNDDHPRSVLIVGGGHAGVSLAQRFADKKSRVTLVCNTERLLPKEDKQISYFFETLLLKSGVTVHTGADIAQTRVVDGAIAATLNKNGSLSNIEADKLVIAAGLVPHTEGLHLERAGVYVGEGGVVNVNEEMRTSAVNIWAAGSVTGTHRLSEELHQAEAAAKNMFAPFYDRHKLGDEPLPTVFPTWPAFARIGLTEDEARAKHKDAHAIIGAYADSDRAVLDGKTDGFLKIIARKKSGELLGVHAAGTAAEELILYFDLVMQAGHSVFDLLEERHFPALTYGHLIYQTLRRWAA